MPDNPDAEKLIKVASRLVALSTSSRVDWEKDASTDNSFSHSTTDSTVIIRMGSYGTIYMLVRDEDGDTVACVEAGPYDDGHATLEELYQIVRRNALQVDDVLSRLMTELRPKYLVRFPELPRFLVVPVVVT